ncbi:hypothetical protein RRG08_017094 [Elysia crispata]|uniref:Uncharacterized protein n=1 Tax=Elysia crispata TaxID=231223 RepID=A0AAE0ZPE3_9GAST|nr:hypothetical protein RRG08_017094 [Elysia crispata]
MFCSNKEMRVSLGFPFGGRYMYYERFSSPVKQREVCTFSISPHKPTKLSLVRLERTPCMTLEDKLYKIQGNAHWKITLQDARERCGFAPLLA